MRKLIIALAALVALASCGPKEQKVMARFVPERCDDFVWENDYIIYRAYGPGLEWETISPGFDLWVKNVPELVADSWYEMELTGVQTYHLNHDGHGKDCYKVGRSLGAGASAPVVSGELVLSPKNYASWEIISSEPSKVVFALTYAPWQVGSDMVGLRKVITVEAGTRFCSVEDEYTGDFETLTVAAGVICHNVLESRVFPGGFAIWEEASDQGHEPEDGLIGLAVVMPEADSVTLEGPSGHAVALKTIHKGEKVSYRFGSVWSKAEIKTAQDWFNYVTIN